MRPYSIRQARIALIVVLSADIVVYLLFPGPAFEIPGWWWTAPGQYFAGAFAIFTSSVGLLLAVFAWRYVFVWGTLLILTRAMALITLTGYVIGSRALGQSGTLEVNLLWSFVYLVALTIVVIKSRETFKEGFPDLRLRMSRGRDVAESPRDRPRGWLERWADHDRGPSSRLTQPRELSRDDAVLDRMELELELTMEIVDGRRTYSVRNLRTGEVTDYQNLDEMPRFIRNLFQGKIDWQRDA